MKKTISAGPRYKTPVSEGEMKRRLAAVQSAMKTEGIDCCVAQCHSDIFDSAIRYLTDSRAHSYTTVLIIPSNGLITMITHGGDNDNAPLPPSLRNVEKLILKPYCQPFCCTDGISAGALLKELKAGSFKKIGFIFKQLISLDLAGSLPENLPGVEFTDFSKQFSRIKAIKSEEEWALADRCVRAHEHLIDIVPSLLRPGRMEFEVIADIESSARYLDCEFGGNIAVGSSPRGSSCFFQKSFAANRRIEAGDVITVMIEAAGPGGIYGELARTFCLGDAHRELLELYNIGLGAQRAAAAAAKPGITGSELDKIYNEFVAEFGFPPNNRMAGHGQGYDMMEAPGICPGEDMTIEEDMLFAIHPELVRGSDFCIACDNFRIRKDGAELITRTPQKIFVIEY